MQPRNCPYVMTPMSLAWQNPLLANDLLMEGNIPPGLSVDDVWDVAAAVARFGTSPHPRVQPLCEPKVVLSLPRRSSVASVPHRPPSLGTQEQLSPQAVRKALEDILTTVIRHRRDLTDEDWLEDVQAFICRDYPTGVSDPFMPWEEHLGAPGGGLIAWRLPQPALLQALQAVRAKLGMSQLAQDGQEGGDQESPRERMRAG